MTSRPSSSRQASAKAKAAAVTAATAVTAPFEYDDELTEYERERLAKIEENKCIMMELGEWMFFFRSLPTSPFVFACSKKNSTYLPSLPPLQQQQQRRRRRRQRQ